MSYTPQPILQPMQHLDPSPGQWSFIEQWRQRVTSAWDSDSNPAEQLPTRGLPDASSHKRKRPAQDSTLRAAAGMSTPPPSNRAQSPSKRMKVTATETPAWPTTMTLSSPPHLCRRTRMRLRVATPQLAFSAVRTSYLPDLPATPPAHGGPQPPEPQPRPPSLAPGAQAQRRRHQV